MNLVLLDSIESLFLWRLVRFIPVFKVFAKVPKVVLQQLSNHLNVVLHDIQSLCWAFASVRMWSHRLVSYAAVFFVDWFGSGKTSARPQLAPSEFKAATISRASLSPGVLAPLS
jgi:hypothetical protein